MRTSPGAVRTAALSLLAAAVLALAAPGAADARDAVVNSFDGTPIVTSFFPAEGLKSGEKAPTVLVGHGWGMSRDTDENSASDELFGQVGLGPLRKAGFNVLTWDARGWGQSGGTVEVDSPDFEGRDVQALLSYVAKQPESLDDAPDDPRAGMTGASYAGGIELVTAGIDKRLDAIAPDIAWHSLITSLNKDGAAKTGWGSVLYGLTVNAVQGGLNGGPAGVQTGGYDPAISTAFQDGLTNGAFSDADKQFFDSRGPGDKLVSRIRAPTMLIEGTADTLFTLKEAITNYAMLRRNGVPTKMMWFCGGHGVCLTEKGETGHIERGVVAWFNRYLKRDQSVDTGPRFEWLADDGTWRTSDDYPLVDRGSLSGDGSGVLTLNPGDTSGGAIAATPAANAINVNIAPPRANAHLVGEPKLSFTYTGTAAPANTFLYAQLVDGASNLVFGNQATPIPVVLDGQEHTIERPLEAISMEATPKSSYRLQLTPGSSLYGPQRSAGAISSAKVKVTLPLGDPVVSSTGTGCARVAGKRPRSKRKLPLAFRRLRGTVARPNGRSLTAKLRVRRASTCVVLTLNKGNKFVARTKPRLLRPGKRTLKLRLKHRLKTGRYALIASGRDDRARTGRVTTRFKAR